MTARNEMQEARRMSNGKWFWVEKRAIQDYVPKVGCLAMCVYHFFASMTDESQRCFPSQQYVAERLGCSRASISRAIQKLKKEGLVYVTKESTNHAVYCLLKIRDSTGANEVSQGRKKDVAPVNTNNTTVPRKNNNTIGNASSHFTEKEKSFAKEIAGILGDTDEKKFLSVVRNHEEQFVREILFQVKHTGTIKKSRTALFFYLVKYYAKRRA